MGPLVWARAIPSTFSRDQKTLRVRRQRLGNQLFANVRAVRISSIDKVDAKLNGSAKNGYRGGTIPGWTPDSFTRQAHGTEAKTVDGEITTE
jgi:hypothetical protein